MNTLTKTTITAVIAAISLFLQDLAPPVFLLVCAMIIDYITGLMAAPHRADPVSSERGMAGIKKKAGMLLLVLVGLILDVLVLHIRESFHLDCVWPFAVSAMVAVWLTANELISILENVRDMGVPLPPFLLSLIKNIQGKTEKSTPGKTDQDV